MSSSTTARPVVQKQDLLSKPRSKQHRHRWLAGCSLYARNYTLHTSRTESPTETFECCFRSHKPRCLRWFACMRGIRPIRCVRSRRDRNGTMLLVSHAHSRIPSIHDPSSSIPSMIHPRLVVFLRKKKVTHLHARKKHYYDGVVLISFALNIESKIYGSYACVPTS